MILKKHTYLLLTIVFILRTISAIGDQKPLDIKTLYFESISTKDNLPNSVIRNIDQDTNGFLWFGSNDGLFRYDGQNYLVFRNVPNDLSSLSFNYILDMHLDIEDNPWVLTYRSLDYLDSRAGKFRHYRLRHEKNDPNDIGSGYQFTITPEKNIFITSVGHGLLLLANTDSIIQPLTNFKRDYPILANNLEAITYHDHCLYIGKKFDGIYKITLSADNLKVTQVEKILSSNHAETFTIIMDQTERLWAGTSDGVILYNTKNNTSVHFSYNPQVNLFVQHREILSLFVDDQDNLWIGSRENGLSIVPVSEIISKGNRAIGYKYTTGTSEGSLVNRCINKIFGDQRGNIWLGTYSGGLHLVGENKNKIHALKYSSGHPDSPSYPKIWGITQAKDGNIWLGTDGGGIDVWNPQQGIIKRIKYSSSGNGLSDNAILCALTDKEGTLWFGTYRGGINRINPKNGKIKVYPQVPSAEKGKFASDIRCIYQDSKGRIWIGTNWKGVCYYDCYTDSFVNVEELGNIDVRAITESKKGGLWIGTLSRGGLIWFDPETKKLKNFTANPENQKCLPSNDIYCLKEDSEGKIWIGTQYGGLSCLDPKEGHFENFDQDDGLGNNTILSFLEDSKGYFWLSTNEGISRFDPVAKSFINYDQTNGVLPGEFLNGSCLAAKDGTFYFGGSNGLNYFQPNFVQPSEVAPKVVFTDLKIFNERVIPGNGVINTNIEFNPEVWLTYQQSVFTIDFQAIQYPFASKCQYQYMLEGYDEKWNYAGMNNSATYRQLPQGNYTLKVKASNSDGIWNDVTASIQIKIIPPFWKTIWAYLLYVLVLGLVVHLLFRFRMKQIKMLNQLNFEQKIRQKEQKIHHERLEFFTNISHELRTPLTLIICAIDDLKRHLSKTKNEKIAESVKTAGYHSSRLFELINQLLEFRRIETGTPQISIERLNLNKWMAEYLSNFKELAENKSIALKLSMPVNSIELWVDPDKLSMIMNNLLSNAFKYVPPQGIIEVTAEESPKEIIIEVSDSGSGISSKALPYIFNRYFKTENNSTSTGIGLSLTKSLIELHKGEIRVDSVSGKGSSFTISFLKGNQHFNPDQLKISIDEEESLPAIFQNDNPRKADNSLEHKIMLIIEDNSDISTLLAEKFSSTFEVHIAENGERGIELACKLIPDIIISDIMMPGIQGTEVCKTLKNSAETSHIPIILLTAKGTIDDELTGLNTGADDYIAKPFNFRILEARVRTLIQNRISLFHFFKINNFDGPAIVSAPKNMILDKEQKFLVKIEQLIFEKYLSADSSVFKLAEDLNFSRSSLYRKIKMLTGLSINEFVRSVRIRKAVQLIEEGDHTISEAAYLAGFNDLKYFRENFVKQVGETPSAYKKKVQKK